ncbi:Farnesyl diphosphate synthase [Paraliobacillus sp. PM-2]|uniref:polyprenyl synthetase family protein n=1 Tax=Paraliobacillus sp. PM-2 TaxID=1462524 RepID=UPI00061BDC7F|nr:farnesyl diphosphate synthase [Paraliobacillus sp. PM-2]CQR46782.1 Farnesyl diphosphate synthase [Paraliobacillus sp. PM-2]
MTQDLATFINDKEKMITDELINKVAGLSIPDRLKESMLYSIKAGGKRLRPLLMIASCEAYGGTDQQVLNAALALEMIHTYSLIHDDLPAMDNDDLRRGMPTNHRVFDEATAILAGDALLTYSFELIASDEQLTETQRLFVLKRLAEVSGPKGMVAGQSLDMEAENKEIELEELETIHQLKTGQLLYFALEIGAYIGGANNDQLHAIKEFAAYLGLIFQVQDDILDVTGDAEQIGKPIGSDELNLKSTYPKLLGLEGAINKKQAYVTKANEALIDANVDSTILKQFLIYVSDRES